MNRVRSSDYYRQQLKKQPRHVFSFSFLVGVMWKNAVIIQTIIYYVSVNVQFSMNSSVWNTKSPKSTQKKSHFFSSRYVHGCLYNFLSTSKRSFDLNM